MHNEKFKEKTPKETINQIKNIFSNLGVEITESWQEKSSVDTYALRVELNNTGLGANGKGITREYAKASAYAELIERYQNGILGPKISFGDKFPFLSTPDEKVLCSKELIEENNSFLDVLFEHNNLTQASSGQKLKFFRDTQKVDYYVYGNEDSYVCVPFYNVFNKEIEYLPQCSYTLYYGSNGMCAGNTPAEAIVQGLSEIIERKVQSEIMLNPYDLPDIPQSYIDKFPYISNRLNEFKKVHPNYLVRMKQCSSKWPVAAHIISEKNSGKYGVKFGCHPKFDIAIERTLTEATQGQDLISYAQRSIVCFDNIFCTSEKNIYNSFKTGVGCFPYQLLVNSKTATFKEPPNIDSCSNIEVANSLLRVFKELGYEVLIRDVSNLGFPSFHIIIPRFSEMQKVDDLGFRATNTRYFVSKMLSEIPENITKENVSYLIATLDYYLGNVFENTLSSYYSAVEKNDIPFEDVNCGCHYCLAMCCILRRSYDRAIKHLSQVIKVLKRNNDTRYSLVCAERNYIENIKNSFSHVDSIKMLQGLYSNDIIKDIDKIFANHNEILLKQYPSSMKNGVSNRKYYEDKYTELSRLAYLFKEAQSRAPIKQGCALVNWIQV